MKARPQKIPRRKLKLAKESLDLSVECQKFQRRFFMELFARTGILERWRADKKSSRARQIEKYSSK